MLVRGLGTGILALGLALTMPMARALDVDPASDSRLAGFLARAERYAALHRKLESQGAPLRETDSPEQIAARGQALGQALRRSRRDARVGDLFGDARAPIAAIVRADWQRRTPEEQKGLLSELLRLEAPAVNSVYPASLPLATFPPGVLMLLPELPEELEYRYFGRHLILRDAEANLVVDVIPDVLSNPVSEHPAR
jgi:hypothetical protein